MKNQRITKNSIKVVKKRKTISKKSLQKALETIEKHAGSTSKIAYVYPYLDSNIGKVNKYLNNKSLQKVNTRDAKLGKELKVKSTKKWAVRVEGNSSPVKKTFTSKKSAEDHAKRLLAKGRAKEIKVVNK